MNAFVLPAVVHGNARANVTDTLDDEYRKFRNTMRKLGCNDGSGGAQD